MTKRNGWSGVAIGVGAGMAIVASLALGSAAAYETYLAKKPAHISTAYQATLPTVDPVLEKRAHTLYRNKRWYKGFTDRPDSCALMVPMTTPSDDVISDGGHAYIVDAKSHDGDYSLFYTDGFRSWVYSSSENECRHAVSAWIWHHTIDAAD